MSSGTTSTIEPVPVPYKDTGHPLRDWIAWRIANTQPGQPVFPVINDLFKKLIPLLLKMITG